MPDSTVKANGADEVQQLRDRIKALEEELKHERREKHKEKDTGKQLEDSWDAITDQMNRLTRGLFYATMEAMSVSANMTRHFVDQTEKRNSKERRDTWSKLMTDLPVDMSKAFVDTLKSGAADTEKIVDKFYAKYKE